MLDTPIIIRDQVKELIRRDGESETARRLGLSRYAVVKLSAGSRVCRGTLTVAAVALGMDPGTFKVQP